MTPAARELVDEIERCIAAVEADVTVGTNERLDDRVVQRLEALADRADLLAAAAPLAGGARVSGPAPPRFASELPRKRALRDPEVDSFVRSLTPDGHARLAASESERLARAATPSARVAAAARAAAGVLRARLAGTDVAIEAPLAPVSDVERFFVGVEAPRLLRHTTSYRARGLLCSALADLRGAARQAFVVGESAAAGPEAAARDPAPGDGPYRRRPTVPPIGTSDVEVELEIARRADAAGLDALRETIMIHVEAYQAVARARNDTRGLLGPLAFWTRPAIEDLELRARWHRALAWIHLEEAVELIARARRGFFIFDLRQAMIDTDVAMGALRADVDRTGAPIVAHRRDVMRALDRLRAALVRAWGDPGDRGALARAVIEHIQTHLPGPSPIAGDRVRRRLGREELVAVLGESLRATSFVADHHARKHVAGALERRNDLFEHALWRYPPAALAFRLDGVVWRAGSIQAVRAGAAARAVALRGREIAIEAWTQWAAVARSTFGWMPSDQELLARHWGRRLAPASRAPLAPDRSG